MKMNKICPTCKNDTFEVNYEYYKRDGQLVKLDTGMCGSCLDLSGRMSKRVYDRKYGDQYTWNNLTEVD